MNGPLKSLDLPEPVAARNPLTKKIAGSTAGKKPLVGVASGPGNSGDRNLVLPRGHSKTQRRKFKRRPQGLPEDMVEMAHGLQSNCAGGGGYCAARRRTDLLLGLGTVTAYNTVTVHSRVDGQLISVAFKEGQFVHKGDVLAQIDPRPFQVVLEQTEGALAKDQAQRKDAEINFERYKLLFNDGVIPKQQLDTQQTRR